jgi:uncharacterized RDD family membrane protein YckC
MTTDPAPASLRRRGAAAALDVVPLALVASTMIWAQLRRRPGFKPPRSLAVTVQGISLVGSSWLVAAGRATPGQRLLGLRVVDLSTGHGLSFRRALLRNTVRSAPTLLRLALGRRWMGAQRRRQQLDREHFASLHSQVRELHDQYADDPDGLSDALSALYDEHPVRLWKACLDPQVIVPLLYAVALYIPALRSPRHQALHDRVARAMVIRAR